MYICVIYICVTWETFDDSEYGILVGVLGTSIQLDEWGSLSISLDLADGDRSAVSSVLFSQGREVTF